MDVDNKEKHRHVDIATLSIPATVAATGVELGDGTDFVIEAPARVIDQLLECDGSQNQTTAPCIEGVLDLTVATHLVPGITEEEFVNLLHADGNASTSVPGHHHDQDEEKGRLLEDDSNNSGETDNATAFVSVAADPFVQTFQDIGDSVRKSLTQSSFSTSIQTAGVHEAFLLIIPAHRASGNKHYGGAKEVDTDDDKFVLALPEVVGRTTSFRTSAGTNIITEGALAPLPTDVTHVELQVSTIIIPSTRDGAEASREVHLDLVVDRQVPLVGYVILVSGLFALSSIGAALDLQRGTVTPEMKIFWRLSSTSILFLWPAMKSGKIDFSGLSRFEMFVVLPFAAMNYAVMITAFAASLEFTSLVNAFILSNLASLIIILSKLVTGVKVAALEGLGTVVGLSGATICAMAPSEVLDDEIDAVGSKAMIGNSLAVFSSFATSIYLTAAKNLRPRFDLFLFMFLIFALASVFQLAYIIFSGQSYELSTDDEIGIFGWLSLRKDRLFLELYMAIICNGVGTTGYVALMKYFDPVAVAMVMLMEPVVALFQGIAVGVATLPGWITWLGNAVVVSGSLIVILSGSKKTEIVDATDALHQTETELVKSLNCSIQIKGSRLMKSPMLRRKKGHVRRNGIRSC
jgi:drug/metabolite transporter (DMT)-like permease